MTLDEQIAWLEDKACESLRDAKACEAFDFTDASTSIREEAATLLTIANTLRAMRDAAG